MNGDDQMPPRTITDLPLLKPQVYIMLEAVGESQAHSNPSTFFDGEAKAQRP